MKHIIILILLSFFLSNVAFSQPSVQVTPGEIIFSFDFKRKISPSIRLDYGSNFSSFRQNDKQTLTNSLYSFSAEFGMTASQNFFPLENKIYYAFSKDTLPNELKENYNSILSDNSFYGLNVSSITANNEMSNSNLLSVFVLGPTDMHGSGYKFSDNSGIRFLTGDNISWFWVGYSKVYIPEGGPEFVSSEYADINYFGSSVRFGNKYQSEVQLQIYKISIYGNAQRLLIFPRTKFLKMLGSEIIFKIGNAALGYFTDKIKTNSPYMYPIINFILQTGLNYGITELQKKKMNWPFNTDAPLMIDQYRVGLQLEF